MFYVTMAIIEEQAFYIH